MRIGNILMRKDNNNNIFFDNGDTIKTLSGNEYRAVKQLPTGAQGVPYLVKPSSGGVDKVFKSLFYADAFTRIQNLKNNGRTRVLVAADFKFALPNELVVGQGTQAGLCGYIMDFCGETP